MTRDAVKTFLALGGNIQDLYPDPKVGEPCPEVPCGGGNWYDWPGCTDNGVVWHSSRTAYHWDGKGYNPNFPIPLCPKCAAYHHANWDDMWNSVNGG